MGVRHEANMRYELTLRNPKEFYHEVRQTNVQRRQVYCHYKIFRLCSRFIVLLISLTSLRWRRV